MKKAKGKSLILYIILVMLMIYVYIIFNLFNTFRYIKGYDGDIMYKDNIFDNLNYQVYLKPNDFIKSAYIERDNSYITSLIDYIKTTFSYEYIGNSNVNVNYTYNIKATVLSNYIGDDTGKVTKPIWNKGSVIVDNTKGASKDSHIKINKTVDINISNFNDLVTNFRSTLNVPINSSLEVKFTISITGILPNGQQINKEHYLLMSIPLDVKAFDISTYKNFVNQEIIYGKKHKTNETSYVYAVIYILLLIFNTWIGLHLIRMVLNKNKNKAVLEVEKILKEYEERIITVSNFINYDKVEIVDVTSFDELLELSNETLEPIIYWQRKKDEVWFSIIKNSVLYRYVFYYNK